MTQYIEYAISEEKQEILDRCVKELQQSDIEDLLYTSDMMWLLCTNKITRKEFELLTE